jgi:hypothetical protein
MPAKHPKRPRDLNQLGKLIVDLYAVALHSMYYNFCRIHMSLRCSPAMAAPFQFSSLGASRCAGRALLGATTATSPSPKDGSRPSVTIPRATGRFAADAA